MSTAERRDADSGFTLTEILIAMMLLSIVMVGVLPALVGVMKSGALVRDHTRAKNLTQQRLEQIRDLRFHVDRQNGPFLDLLDIYYTHALTGSTATSVSNGGTTLSGTYVSSGSAAAGEPTAPYFRVTTGDLPGAAGFSQVITSQFLAPNGSVVPASSFQGVSGGTAGYDSQAAGRDEPPSLILEIKVSTAWTQSGRAKKYTATTRVTEARPEKPLIQSQAQAVAVDVTSSAADGSTLQLRAGLTNIDGAQSSGSSVAGYATGAIATQSAQSAVNGLLTSFKLPGTAASTASSASPSGTVGGSCPWYGFGTTSVTNVTGDVSTGLPKAPSNVDSGTPARTMGAAIKANGATLCGTFAFSNATGGGLLRTDARGTAMGPAPFLRIADPSGNADVVSSAGYVTSNALTSSTQRTTSGGSAAVSQNLVLFPGSSLTPSGQGLVTVSLQSVQADCTSGGASSAGTVTGSYTNLVLRWWGKVGSGPFTWHQASWSYSGTGSPVLTGESWQPSQVTVSNGVLLSDLVTITVPGGTSGVLSEGATTGRRGFPDGLLNVTTASTLTNEPGLNYSAIKVRVGEVTCVADDER